MYGLRSYKIKYIAKKTGENYVDYIKWYTKVYSFPKKYPSNLSYKASELALRITKRTIVYIGTQIPTRTHIPVPKGPLMEGSFLWYLKIVIKQFVLYLNYM